MNDFLMSLIEPGIKIAAILGIIMTGVAYTTFAERKVSAFMQNRKGPNRVGPWGLLQPLADGIKFIFKEELIPRDSHKGLFVLAPALMVIPALITWAVIPFGNTINIGGKSYELMIASGTHLGVLYLLAITGLMVYGIIVAGWASNNKYSLLGAFRACSQVVSYELAMGLSAMGVVMAVGSFDLRDIVAYQASAEGGLGLPLVIPQFIGFIVFWVAAFAETNRLPFDLPEGETEIVGGYHTEYSGMKFSMFFIAEYAGMWTAAAFITCLYWGGGSLPLLSKLGVDLSALPETTAGIISMLVFFAKVSVFLFMFIAVRWTIPRFRYDQLMSLGWKNLLPLALLNLIVVAVVMAFRAKGGV